MTIWNIFGVVASLLLIAVILVDGFETMIQPRRITRRYRFARVFYRLLWTVWRRAAIVFQKPRTRESFLALFGPLSLILLFVSWVTGLLMAFSLLHWSLGTPLSQPATGWGTYLYLSGTTFFTLGYGDVTPTEAWGRALAVIESGMGFGFMAVIIGYLPTLYQAFTARERTIGLLDARASSPPTAGELLHRLAQAGRLNEVDIFLREWEAWAAELLESHLSFPVLSYYRSQHDNQSWLAALATILDTCALLLVSIKDANKYQAQLTFAMARHAAVDLALTFHVPPKPAEQERLACDRLEKLLGTLGESEGQTCEQGLANSKLAELRGMYEPFLAGLAERFLFALPPIVAEQPTVDNWRTSAWMKRVPGIGSLPSAGDDHFD